MTHDAANILAARVGELMRADERIAALARGTGMDSAARAAAVLEAIAERERIAAAVIEAIALEDQAFHSRMTTGVVTPGEMPGLAAHLVQRDRSIEALAHVVEARSREYHRIARQIARQLNNRLAAGWPS